MNGICKLCNRERGLVKAHIFPRWIFIEIQKGLDRLGNRQPIFLAQNDSHPKRRPVGSYDSGILCGDCDQFLGRYDEYGKCVFHEYPLVREKDKLFVFRNVNTESLMLFFLSILWRASISSLSDFKNVETGTFEQAMKELLWREKTGKHTDDGLASISIVIGKYGQGYLPDGFLTGSFSLPKKLEIKGESYFVIYMPGGFSVFVKISNGPEHQSLEKIALKASSDTVYVIDRGPFEHGAEYQEIVELIQVD